MTRARLFVLAALFGLVTLHGVRARACGGDYECEDPRSLGFVPISTLKEAKERASAFHFIATTCDAQSRFRVAEYVFKAHGVGDFIHRLLDWPKAEAAAWQMQGWAQIARAAVSTIEHEYGVSVLEPDAAPSPSFDSPLE